MLNLIKQARIYARRARALTPLALALLLSLLLAFAACSIPASAQASYPLTYSGRLVNELGEPLAGPVALEFYFYDGAGVSAVPLRSDPIVPSASLPLSDGVFSAQLNLSATDVQEIFGDPQREVWIEVRAGERVFGRQRFSYVPMALRVPVDGKTIYFDPNDGKLTLKSAGSGSGDMLQSVYDPGKNNKIDLAEDAEKLGGQLPAYYRNASNITSGTLPVAQVPNLDAAKITSGTLAYGRLPVGTAANTIAAGDDARFTDARTPNGAAGGDLSGSYPNPTLKSSADNDGSRPVTSDHIRDGAITTAKLAAGAVTDAKITDDAITSAKIANGTIVDADIATNAAIADSKLATISAAGKVSNSATTATNLNTASAIVARDADGDFSAGRISASFLGDLTGNAASATTASQIQGQAVSSTAPSLGQVLTWSGSAWTAQTLTSGPTTVVSQNANYSVATSDSSKFFLVSGAGTALTLPLAATAGSGFTVTVKAVSGYTIVQVTGSDLLDGVNQGKTLGSQTVAQFVSDGSQWYVGMSYGVLLAGTAVACGSNCYTNSSAMSAGFAATATGKLLQLQNGVWVQADGTNVLRVDGSDNWQLALSLNGRGYSSSNLNKLTANLAGRVCPTNVYVDDTNKVATDRCIYFDGGSWAQRLDAPNADGLSNQTTAGSIRIGARAGVAGNWYEGNIQTCAGKGMRLPVLYETSASDPGGAYKPTDASPTWSTLTNGVPPVGSWTWTASAATYHSNHYWVWSGTSTRNFSYTFNTYAVRCVVQ